MLNRSLIRLRHFGLSGNGSAIYVSGGTVAQAPDDWLNGVFRIPVEHTGDAALLVPLWKGIGGRVQVSNDDATIAYRSGDALFVFNLADSSSRFVDKGDPLAFSPDGSELLYESIYSFGTDKHDLFTVPVNRDATPTRLEQCENWRLQEVRWGNSGLQALAYYKTKASEELFDSTLRIAVLDLPSCEVSRLWELRGKDWLFAISVGLNWSADGTKLAAWIAQTCLRFTWTTCPLSQFKLHVFDTTSGMGQEIATANVTDGHGWPEFSSFSPDGSKLAYMIENKLYVKELD